MRGLNNSSHLESLAQCIMGLRKVPSQKRNRESKLNGILNTFTTSTFLLPFPTAAIPSYFSEIAKRLYLKLDMSSRCMIMGYCLESHRINTITKHVCYRIIMLWPPRSCDLTPLDYFLWGYVKSLVFADKPQTLDHLEDNIHRVIADIRPQMLEKVIEN
ncbi:hypothetical protein TNCV_2934101 [Trichonephila clavipes]|nr:hypothetical protein TNCV_2934101 [Trichonephila clavipes]